MFVPPQAPVDAHAAMPYETVAASSVSFGAWGSALHDSDHALSVVEVREVLCVIVTVCRWAFALALLCQLT